MAVAVHLSGNEQMPHVETTFTENVSARGARVFSLRAWQLGDSVTVASLPGDFRARSRVTYCQRVRSGGFAIGLEFLEPSGHWVIDLSAAPERTLKA